MRLLGQVTANASKDIPVIHPVKTADHEPAVPSFNAKVIFHYLIRILREHLNN